MAEVITLELPEKIAYSARDVAMRTHRRLEDVLVDWLDQSAAELPVEFLPDEQILALCDLQMNDEQQEELSDLLEANREGLLTRSKQTRLDELMHSYRRGLVRKALAWKVAVARGLRSPLN